ncbi:hypothetical protein GCM10010124_28690 [Pilimelia terevasa]|uniref:Activator of Hsp90 ATPase homologue 1/2-like C-terminal domain-containing protein n=1 Tax=Pilimelia terevasa TaxID=53372 RepID=A0A8J3BN42_9ACTN|nr:SRPBCC family protein [Pilimelia terevasa]GGK34338.1 hypothetical protein GCM10010124_28690 [Pilimelia terevasa]
MPRPTGVLHRAADGVDLVLTRTLPVAVPEVWAGLTDPGRTADWFGPWEGEPGAGRTVRVQMAHEEGQPWGDLHIEACTPPRRLAVSMVDEYGTWRLELLLAARDGGTTLELVQHLADAGGVGDIGPGWEFYLDLFVAALIGGPRPDFADYHPAMAPYFAALTPAAPRPAAAAAPEDGGDPTG